MTSFKIECFDNTAELIDHYGSGGKSLEIIFTEEVSGYILFGHLARRIEGKSLILDVSRMPDGEYLPRLVTEGGTIDLPALKKELGVIRPVEYGVEEIRLLRIANKRMDARIASLERKIESIEKKIWGESIF